MNILVVSARLCYPLNTGAKIRAYHLLKTIASKHKVTMVTYYGHVEEQNYFSHFEDMGINIISVFNPKIDQGITLRCFINAMRYKVPLTVAKYQSNEMKFVIQSLWDVDNFDIVYCEHLHMAPMARRIGVPFCLDAHNVESQIAERYADLETNSFRKSVLKWNFIRFREFEMKTVSIADLVLCVSDEDIITFSSFVSGEQCRLLENGVDVDYFAPTDTLEQLHIVFVGSMDWKPNIDGVEYFLKSIFPLIQRSQPNVTFAIVGKDPSPELLKIASSNPFVEVTGTVTDVRPFVHKASICIVPLQVGGGTRLKVLEGFSMGKAVVSTSLGCEGIDCLHNHNILIEDTPEGFASSVLDLLSNLERRRSLGDRARELAVSQYSWDSLGNKLLSYIDRISMSTSV